MAKEKNEKEDGMMIPVKLGDAHNTIIYIHRKENKERAIKKYYKDLEEYQKASIMDFSKGRAKIK